MLKHAIVIAQRNTKRQKSSFLINLIGQATGLACAIFIFMWIQDEVKKDGFHDNIDKLYQVRQIFYTGGENRLYPSCPTPLAEAMEEEIPEVKRAITGMYANLFGNGFIKRNGKESIKANPKYANDGFFEMFSYPLLIGTPGNVLKNKFDAVISEDLALQIFETSEEAIGKTLDWDKLLLSSFDLGGTFNITGVFKKVGSLTSEDFDLVFTFDFFDAISEIPNDWNNDDAQIYVVLEEGANIESVNTKVTSLAAQKREYENRFLHKNIAC